MRVFLSWSGARSKEVAEALDWFLPKALRGVRCFMSASDIESGARWAYVISRELAVTDFGVLCLTPENLDSRWLLFEAGALAKDVEGARVIPYLTGVSPEQVAPPLGLLQARSATRDDTMQLLTTLNAHLPPENRAEDLPEMMEVLWPKLEQRLEQAAAGNRHSAPRRDGEILAEILQGIRELVMRDDRPTSRERETLFYVRRLEGLRAQLAASRDDAFKRLAEHEIQKLEAKLGDQDSALPESDEDMPEQRKHTS